MGKITLIKNNDKSDANRLVRFNGAQLGDPRRTDDVAANLNPKIVDLTK